MLLAQWPQFESHCFKEWSGVSARRVMCVEESFLRKFWSSSSSRQLLPGVLYASGALCAITAHPHSPSVRNGFSVSNVGNLKLSECVLLYVTQLDVVMKGTELRGDSRTWAHFTPLFMIYSFPYYVQYQCTKHQGNRIQRYFLSSSMKVNSYSWNYMSSNYTAGTELH